MKKHLLLALLCALLGGIFAIAQENKDGLPTPDLVVVPGTIQSKVGCSGDWQPDCTNTALTFDEASGLWVGTFDLPAGNYEYKVALNGSWTQNYGADGKKDGANIKLALSEPASVTFTYDHATGIVTDSAAPVGEAPAQASTEEKAPPPSMVAVPGTLNPAMGCSGQWQPDCEAASLVYNEAWDIWSKTFSLPAGNYEYKVAINGSWSENYGGFADKDGPNISLTLAQDTDVTFVYDHKTKWIADNVRHAIVTAQGDFQTFLGCESNDDATCLASWLQDPDADGVYSLSTRAIPAGDYSAQFAVNFGADGVGEPVAFNVPSNNTPVTFTYDRGLNLMVVTAGGSAISGANLRELRAHWVDARTLLWKDPNEGSRYQIFYSPNAEINVSLFGIRGDYSTLDLTPAESIPDSALAKFPHLANLSAYTIAEDDLALVEDILRGQFVIAEVGATDNVLDMNGVQIAGVLDDLYTYDGALGVTLNDGVPTLSVWAPTAQNVALLLFDDSRPRTAPTEIAMTRNAQGAWSVTGEADWLGKFYLYRVTVFAPSVQEIVVNDVTDPYSISLSTNSQRSQIVDLDDPALKPEGWDSLAKPALANPEDITLYELHIRDFSAFDASVPEELRGTYLAFTLPDSDGMKHLKALADAGLTHLHTLPSFDLATINENRARWFNPDYDLLATYPPDSDQQQAAIEPIRDLDGFNWGYDPFHYMTPEGSYATDPNGAQRILEYRQMVQALNEAGLRFVQDVVFNHTNASGQSNKSVLDRVVPGYYHRLNDRGVVERSTCCDNTATEHNMMRRLMVDTVVLMAKAYKVDGFRFDLMGHHMLADMLEVRAALDALTLEADGVDGKSIYVYGEGWNFGEVANNTRGVNATQLNIAGTGIGVFNDRLRDAVRGGNPFGDREKQGLANGILSNPNGLADVNASYDRATLFADQTRVGLAGNLRDYTFIDRSGNLVTGAEVDYNGSPVGYTADPQENIVYVDKHDNETLFDNNVFKAPQDTSAEDRVRMQTLGSAFVMYSQGIPFFQAGTDLLRSKSLDRNSYNSGDWFNRLDWTYQTNNFGVGLPPAGDNSGEWNRMRPFLADPTIAPAPENIVASAQRFQDMLRVRYSSPLFRLTTGADVQERVYFYNVGLEQIGGLIVMHLSDEVGADLDPNHKHVLVIFNTTNDTLSGYMDDALVGLGTWELHPILANGADDLMKEASYDEANGFSIPRYSAAVFVIKQ
jgi:pullulanase-type alpha-1,6-glucosidase